MKVNSSKAHELGVAYLPLLEESPGQSVQVLSELVRRSCCLIADDFPSRYHTKRLAQISEDSPVLVEKVDSNGLVPMKSVDKVYARAFGFRRFLHKNLYRHFEHFPVQEPLQIAGKAVLKRSLDLRSIPNLNHFTTRSSTELVGEEALRSLPIDHSVRPVTTCGGESEARQCLEDFVNLRLHEYSKLRNHPELDRTSQLSPFLHQGHISSHQILQAIAKAEEWSPSSLSSEGRGQRDGWWKMSPSSEAFLDELVTWRELGFNMAWQCPDYDKFESLPDWARKTLNDHAADPRNPCYTLSELEQASTHDSLWNAAQVQLVEEGRIHNYLRMLWGKKILEWTPSPQIALDVMIELNNKYALDGRDPNSYTGIAWVLGRYDRPWGPERPIFGKIRYMSSKNTGRKFPVKNYILRYSR
jgi:deoxyribodipyrimidine photo-lyase